MSFPVTRPAGRALIVGNSAFRQEPLRLLRQQGFDCAEANDAYAAMIELSRQRLTYRALILCVASFYREELHFIAAVKRRVPHIDIWLTQTDGRISALAEAMNLGADGVLAEDGSFHRLVADPAAAIAASGSSARPVPVSPRQTATTGANGGTELLPEEPREAADEIEHQAPASLTGEPTPSTKLESSFGSVEGSISRAEEAAMGEPVLTAEELKALLQDQPAMPPSSSGGSNERSE